MGARPSSFKKSGGFLNGVDGVITGYRFTDEFNGEPFQPGKKPGTQDDKFHSLFFEVSVRVDGADEDITQNLFAGGADNFEVSADEHTLTPNEDGYELGAGTPFAKFIVSLCESGFPEASLPEDEINYESIIGTRVRFKQEPVLDAQGKVKKRKAKKGKFAGREFDETTTVVDQVYELPGKAGKGAKGKPAAAPVKGKSKPAPEPDEDDAVTTLAKETLIDILADNDGKIAKSKVSMAVIKKLQKHKDREAVRKLIYSDDFLNEQDGWTYDATSKNQMIEAE